MITCSKDKEKGRKWFPQKKKSDRAKQSLQFLSVSKGSKARRLGYFHRGKVAHWVLEWVFIKGLGGPVGSRATVSIIEGIES